MKQTQTINPKNQPLKYLTDSEYENLIWEGHFSHPNLVRIRTPLDGSCLFHAIAKSYFKPYITGRIDHRSFNRKDFITKLRKSLSIKLGTKINPSDPYSPTYYETLSRGQLPIISKQKGLEKYSLENMQKELDSNQPVDNIYNEFISNQLNKDIYILDAVKKDVYITGFDDDILYKNRPSIVILYIPGHYELIGVNANSNTNNTIKVLFDPNDDLIISIKNRIRELKTMRK